jgi:hypothetical protein
MEAFSPTVATAGSAVLGFAGTIVSRFLPIVGRIALIDDAIKLLGEARTLGNQKLAECPSAFKFDGIASRRMLLDNFSPMTGSAPPNRFGVVDGGKDQHGCAARSDVGGDGALPVGQPDGEGTHPRRAVRDDGLASQACGARAPTARDGWAGRGRGTARAQA